MSNLNTSARPTSRRRKQPPTPAVSQNAAPDASGSKLDQVIVLLRREQGATLADLMTATGWQAHSVRGAIAGAVKKKLGSAVLSERVDGVRTYRVVSVQP